MDPSGADLTVTPNDNASASSYTDPQWHDTLSQAQSAAITNGQPSPAAIITGTTGNISVMPANSSNWTPGTPGTLLYPGDHIKADDTSVASLTLPPVVGHQQPDHLSVVDARGYVHC